MMLWGTRAESGLELITHAVSLQVLLQLTCIPIQRSEPHSRASTILGIAAVGSIGFELITSLRLTTHDHVVAILRTIHACAVALYSLGTILRRRLR